MNCSFCNGTEQVGKPGCNDIECDDLFVCKYCDVDGSNYNGWCEEVEEMQMN